MFDDLKCPCCKNKGCLSFHKKYSRNLVINEDNKTKEETIDITIVKCKICSKNNNCQKYHALLPFFILPYQMYEADIIINAIYERFIKKIKIESILEKYKISHKLFYDWLKKFNKYLLPSSTILKVDNKLDIVIDNIHSINYQFLYDFFSNFEHPFFLFRLTCVSLCIRI